MKWLLFVCMVFFSVSCAKVKTYSVKSSSGKDMPITYTQFRSQQKSFETTAGKIAYMDRGEVRTGGETIVLLHGVPTSGWLYRKMIDQLVAKGNRVIVPDMLGFGSSESPQGYDIYTPDQHAERLLALMDHLNVKQWTHVFHDAGGMWTWSMLEKQPHRVQRLVILNTIILQEGFHPPAILEKGATVKLAMWGYRNKVTSGLMLRGLYKAGLKDPKLITDREKEGYRTPLVEGKTRALHYFFSNVNRDLPDYGAVIEKIKVPVTVIWGKHDEMLVWSDQDQEVIRRMNLKESDVHVLDAKHFIQEEMPDQIVNIISP